MYAINFTNGNRITAAELLETLDLLAPTDARAAKSAAAVRRLMAEGCRYSNQDFDVLGSAHGATFCHIWDKPAA